MAKEAAMLLLTVAAAANIRFPATFHEKEKLQSCASTLLSLPKKDDDSFDIERALAMLEEKFGKTEDSGGKKRKNEEGVNTTGSPKKKKIDDMVIEENRGLAGVIKEMADIYFQNGDRQRGGVYSKAAKAIRECAIHITNGKQATTLKGVGKGIASMTDEFLSTGYIKRLEEMRAGTA